MAPLGPFGPHPRIVAGVSGGPHSLALALLLARWNPGGLVAGVVDHGLRADSAPEAETVAGWLAARGIAVRVLRLGLAPGTGTQERARDGRIAALLGLAAEVGAGWVALGQHRGDQAETLLLRGLAGSGPAGLAGMASARTAGAALLIRPLLDLAPARLEAVVAEAGLLPIRDPSNANPAFSRVRLRQALADPAGEGPAVAALSQAAEAFGRRRADRDQAVAARLAAAATLNPEGHARIDLPALGRDKVAEAALAALLRAVSGSAFAPGPEAVAGLLARGAGTLGGARLGRDGLLSREIAALAPPAHAVAGLRWDGRFLLEGAPPPGCRVGALGNAALPRPGWLPAAVFPTLPALFRDCALVAVPALSYPDPEVTSGWRLRFAPRAGSVT